MQAAAVTLGRIPTQADALRLAAGDAVLELDTRGRVLDRHFAPDAPPSLLSMFEPGDDLVAHVHADDRAAVRTALEAASLGGELARLQARLIADPQPLDVEWRIASCRVDGRARLVAVARNTSEQQRTEQRLRHLATHDALTALPNRSFLDEQLPALARQAALNDESLALGVVDLDGFKRINDSLGHPAGDELLRAVASRLSSVVRDTDVVARTGGDEFVVVLPHVGCAAELQQMGRRITAALEAPVPVAGQLLHVSASVGFAVYPDHATDVVRLTSNADMALYRAKAAGKNRTVIYDPHWGSGEDSFSLETALRAGFAAGQFFPVYQPILEVTTGRVVGCEALMRWHRPGVGLVAPSAFIPVAESMGLIDALGMWILRAACVQVLAFERLTGKALFVAVNVSPAQFHGDLARKVLDSLALAGLAPERLRLEITEGTLMRDPRLTEEVLRALAAQKVRLAVDDFGTGHSSFAYLRNFPLSTLKVDRTFIANLPHSRKDSAICSALFHLSDALGLQCVAEGVETEEQMGFLRERHCLLAQGYLLGKPMQANEFVDYLSRNACA